MISLGGQAPHVRCTPLGRTCGEPSEIELTDAHSSIELLFARYDLRTRAAKEDGGEDNDSKYIKGVKVIYSYEKPTHKLASP